MRRSALINFICSMLITVLLVIGVLLGLIFLGKLDVEQNKLVISSASHTITYDGKTLTDGKWSLMEGNLKEGHKLVVNVTGSQTNVGMSENHVSATVQDANGGDVTGQYNIEYRPGALQVKARELTVVAESDMKLYDGKPLTCNAYMLQSSVALLSTDELRVIVEGSITEIGETDNVVTSVEVYSKATGEDMSRNYNIHSKNGKLVVYDENTLVIKSGSAEQQYNPTQALTCHEYEIVNGQLRPGHELEITYTGSQLLPGWSENTFEVRIIDTATGADVTATYDILMQLGKLIVTNRQVAVQGMKATGIYGTSSFMSNDQYVVTDGLPEGYVLDMSDAFLGEIQAFDYGKTTNTIDPKLVKVYDETGNDVTEYFDILPLAGELEVLSPEVQEVDLFTVTSTSAGDIYLKQMSYGNYDPITKRWGAAPVYENASAPIPSSYYLTSAGCKRFSSASATAEITPLAGIFALPYYAQMTDDNHLQSSDALIEGDASGVYTVDYYKSTLNGVQYTGADLLDYEVEYAAFVKENYLEVEGETLAFMLEYAEKYNLNTGNVRTTVEQVAKHLRSYWQSGLSYDMKYNRQMDKEDDPIVAFLSEYKKGVCRHYAQAATLLFRSMGIPARYTVGFYGSLKNANTPYTITNKQAHAWVEVYIEDLGWMYVEVTGTELKPVELTITPNNVERMYSTSDTVPLKSSKITLTVAGESWSTFEALGYTYEYAFWGERLEPGKTKSEIRRFVIYGPDGMTVYEYESPASGQKGSVIYTAGIFNVTMKTGTLHVYRGVVTVTSGNFSKVYGDEWDDALYDGYTFRASSGEFLGGIEAIPAAANTFNKIGETKNTYKIIGERADEYKYVPVLGKLTVTQRDITIVAGSGSAVFDGTPKTYDEETAELSSYLASTLAPGDWIDWDALEILCGEITNPGDVCDTIIDGTTLVIYNAKGENVTEFYSASFETGSFEIVIG